MPTTTLCIDGYHITYSSTPSGLHVESVTRNERLIPRNEHASFAVRRAILEGARIWRATTKRTGEEQVT